MLVLVLVGVGGLAFALAAGAGWSTPRPVHRPALLTRAAGAAPGGRVRVDVGVRVKDPDLPAVRRLVDRAARAHLERPDVQVVEVVDLDGRVVGRRRAHRTGQRPAPGSDPSARTEPSESPLVDITDAVAASFALGPAAPGTTTSITDRLDLPPSVAGGLADRTSVGGLVTALFHASGTPVTTYAGVSVVGDMAVVSIDAVEPTGRVTETELDEAYLRFKASGARHGIAITDGQLPPRELERRHLLAPELRHGGIEALQLLADDVALGGDITASLRELTSTSEHPSPTGG